MKLTTDEKAERIEFFVSGGLYVIVKQGAYYRPAAHGYTTDLKQAWKLPLEYARKYEVHAYLPEGHPERVFAQKAPPAAYFEDLNCIQVAWEKLTFANKGLFVKCLHEVMAERLGLDSPFDVPIADLVSAKVGDRAEALGRVLKLWEVGQ